MLYYSRMRHRVVRKLSCKLLRIVLNNNLKDLGFTGPKFTRSGGCLYERLDKV